MVIMMNKPTYIIKKYTNVSLMLRIFIGLIIGALLGLLVPSWTGIGILGRISSLGVDVGTHEDEQRRHDDKDVSFHRCEFSFS